MTKRWIEPFELDLSEYRIDKYLKFPLVYFAFSYSLNSIIGQAHVYPRRKAVNVEFYMKNEVVEILYDMPVNMLLKTTYKLLKEDEEDGKKYELLALNIVPDTPKDNLLLFEERE